MGKDKGKAKGGGKGRDRIQIENVDELILHSKNDEEDSEDEEEETTTKVKSKTNNTKSKKIVDEDEEDDNDDETEAPVTVNAQKLPGGENAEPQMSRREREALEAARRKADYERRHLALETEQAQADMARLAIVRQRREEARLKREAEGRAPGYSQYGVESDDEEGGPPKPKATPAAPVVLSEAQEKKKAAALASTDESQSDQLPILKAMDIKKMSADALKDHLKARKLDIQGQKKDLIKRLCDYEAAR